MIKLGTRNLGGRMSATWYLSKEPTRARNLKICGESKLQGQDKLILWLNSGQNLKKPLKGYRASHPHGKREETEQWSCKSRHTRVEQDGGNKWVKGQPASLLWFPWICGLFIHCTEGSSQPLMHNWASTQHFAGLVLGAQHIRWKNLMESIKTEN